jgi:hypothetical protein
VRLLGRQAASQPSSQQLHCRGEVGVLTRLPNRLPSLSSCAVYADWLGHVLLC